MSRGRRKKSGGKRTRASSSGSPMPWLLLSVWLVAIGGLLFYQAHRQKTIAATSGKAELEALEAQYQDEILELEFQIDLLEKQIAQENRRTTP